MSEQKVTKTADDALAELDAQDALERRQGKSWQIFVLSLVAIATVLWTLTEAPPGIAIAFVLLAVLGLKQAVLEYRALKSDPPELLAGGDESSRSGAGG